jgi:hypothetical protein
MFDEVLFCSLLMCHSLPATYKVASTDGVIRHAHIYNGGAHVFFQLADCGPVLLLLLPLLLLADAPTHPLAKACHLMTLVCLLQRLTATPMQQLQTAAAAAAALVPLTLTCSAVKVTLATSVAIVQWAMPG